MKGCARRRDRGGADDQAVLLRHLPGAASSRRSKAEAYIEATAMSNLTQIVIAAHEAAHAGAYYATRYKFDYVTLGPHPHVKVIQGQTKPYLVTAIISLAGSCGEARYSRRSIAMCSTIWAPPILPWPGTRSPGCARTPSNCSMPPGAAAMTRRSRM